MGPVDDKQKDDWLDTFSVEYDPQSLGNSEGDDDEDDCVDPEDLSVVYRL